MLELKSKDDCCGCSACVMNCPIGCISMKEDYEGFSYPIIDESKCLKCGKCKKVCPVLNKAKEKEGSPSAYAAYSKDKTIVKNSSSGGMFTMFARWIIKNGGIVYGATMSSDCKKLFHISAENESDLEALRGSKYIQSSIGTVYREVREQLHNGRKVLFTGTPCQIEALKSYLAKEYDNLYTMDIVCHGVASPKLWRKYIEYIENEKDDLVNKIFFRHKKYGWRTFSLLFEFSNNKKYSKIFKEDLFGQAFLQNLCLRPSCHSCAFKKINRVSDITVGDFWANAGRLFDDDTGISLVLVHSAKGKELLKSVQSLCYIKELDSKEAINGNTPVYKSVEVNKNREFFFSQIDSMPVVKLLKKYVSSELSLRLRVKFFLKKVGII